MVSGCENDTVGSVAVAENSAILAGDGAVQELQFRDAISLYTEAIDSGTLESDALLGAYMKRGNAYLQDAEWNTQADSDLLAALSDASRGRELAPDLSDAIDLEATVYQLLGAYPEALALFQRSYEVDNSDPFWSLINIGETYRMMGDYETALRYYNHLLERPDIEPGMAIYYHRGLTFFVSGRYSEAIDSLNNGVRYQRDYTFAYIYRACAYARIGDYRQAIRDYDFALVRWRREEPQYGHTTYWKTVLDRLVVELSASRALSNGAMPVVAPTSFCEEFNSYARKRERSALLPPASGTPTILDFDKVIGKQRGSAPG